MKWTIVTVGKPALAWAKDAVKDYQQRIERAASLKLIPIKEAGPQKNGIAMQAIAEKHLRIALDERGKSMRSLEFSEWIQRNEMQGTKGVTVFIGGADGHSDDLLSSVHETWSLSNLTLQHELALVVLLEQIYRGYSILRGAPYHRE